MSAPDSALVAAAELIEGRLTDPFSVFGPHDTEEGRVFTHTEILPGHEHQGYGSRLVRAALDDTRSAGLKPIGRCSMVRNFLAEHPDYARV